MRRVEKQLSDLIAQHVRSVEQLTPHGVCVATHWGAPSEAASR
jgi:hypothetical protein